MAAAKSADAVGPLVVAKDVDGFFGLFIDNLVNLLIIATTLIGVFHFPAALVYGRIVPAAALSVLVGNLFYTWQARRLARREGRSDVTALPYGISTPVMFAYLFLVIGPVYWKTQDPNLAWQIGMAAAFMGGGIEFLGAFVGKRLRDMTPRSAMLGTLAGIAITFIAMKPTLGIWEHPEVGFLPLAIILVGFVARVAFPWRIPAGFLALAGGTAVAWAFGFQDAAAVTAASKNLALHLPWPSPTMLLEALRQALPFLTVVLPLGIYNFLETMQNVESAAAAGDDYDTKETMMADGAGTMIGALFGSCFPTTVYIGHPGWKAVGARQGYTLLNGIALFVVGIFGLLALATAIIPKEVAFCILLYIGLVIGAQSFQTSDAAHAPAVLIAFIPHIANFVRTNVNGALMAAGQNTAAIGPGLMAAMLRADVHYEGLSRLGDGAIVTGLLLGAITAFLIDRLFFHAAGYAATAAAFSYVGVIHAPAISMGAAPAHAKGYLILTIFFGVLGILQRVRGKPLACAEV